MLTVKQTNELTSQELVQVLKERVAVFVVEQNCPYQEVDADDFDNLHVTATTKEEAVHRASEVLLRTLAIAAQKGERVPSPGALPVNDPDYIMICPLNPGSTPL